MRMLLHGGPERWRQGVEFVESSSVVAYDGKTQVKESIGITQLIDGGGRLYWISCHSLGNFVGFTVQPTLSFTFTFHPLCRILLSTLTVIPE